MFATHLLAHPFSPIANLVSMMETGVPERFPELKIAFTEGGLGWVPWIMLRMDKEYAERRREVAILKDRPSTYVRRMFFATQPIEEPEHLADMATLLTLFGGEDWSVRLRLAAPRLRPPQQGAPNPVSDEVRRKIMGGNALHLLRLRRRCHEPAYVVAKVDDVPEGRTSWWSARPRDRRVQRARPGLRPAQCLFSPEGPLCRGAISGTVVANAETGWKRAWVSRGRDHRLPLARAGIRCHHRPMPGLSQAAAAHLGSEGGGRRDPVGDVACGRYPLTEIDHDWHAAG